MDERTYRLEMLKMIFGFLLLVMLSALAGVIALGKIEQQSSYGLEYILGALAVLAGGFAQWAFSKTRTKDVESQKGEAEK